METAKKGSPDSQIWFPNAGFMAKEDSEFNRTFIKFKITMKVTYAI